MVGVSHDFLVSGRNNQFRAKSPYVSGVSHDFLASGRNNQFRAKSPYVSGVSHDFLASGREFRDLLFLGVSHFQIFVDLDSGYTQDNLEYTTNS